ncbi:16S rRNA (cytosine(1402)-N(4))-methyltransferase RsmH [Mumia zhuanghuii]|uniref:Ribosomal RNA small subunit methyltransferase H n=1 Tax=Mumia zhuanghuii TaxID=2585211 RepID=A0A5C4MDM6_9ACTN|nr:16S rRNA (cytosine(1402)-N(4))-methyltransferase RsmH [Mumia zhuanghuii]TNC38134.1 16S rRNA (cytosine(1402)-N(4))-methyltransferase RsmH [Mumia zhuanghuii]TNC38637.1 16S rRNA (cytosine(1402)-N(4))-methyltransferase RsmH [Mumia zhuanghuii]
MGETKHVPVLLERTVELLTPALSRSDAVLVDATLGLGGHSEAVLSRFPDVHVIGIDRDAEALRLSRERLAPFEGRVTFYEGVYDEITDAIADAGRRRVAAVLFDLGVSSMQLDEDDRGFSYARPAPLDMRMGQEGTTAAEILATYDKGELVRILRTYGEEKHAGRIADAIVRRRETAPLRTSDELVALVREALPAAAMRTGGNPAKRTFQALRIEVNDELGVLRRALPAALDAVDVGGRVVVMAYQSLEDRIVKKAFAAVTTVDVPPGLPVVPEERQPRFTSLTRGAETASEAEIAENPRAKPVRLRAVERVRESA